MPGVATKISVADQVRDALLASGSPSGGAFSDPATAPFAILGALGAALPDLMSARPDVGDNPPNSPYFRAWWPLLQLIAGDSTASPPVVGLLPSLQTLRSTLSRLDTVLADEDTIALIGLAGDLNALSGTMTAITTALASLTASRTTIALNIAASGPLPKVAPASSWRARDTNQMARTGEFLQAQRNLADDSGDPLQQAFALGSVVGYACDICGNGFVNSIVQSPYRNHWWRTRWISNYVDTWVHGYYGAGGAAAVAMSATGDPTPPYTTWPNVGEAQLHRRIEVGGITAQQVLDAINTQSPVPDFLPASIVTFWLDAYEKTHGIDPHTIGIDESAVQSAYAALYLTLWLQTSGEFLPAVPPDQINFPDNCGDRPPWVAVDGSVVVGGSTIATPPTPGITPNPNVAEIVSGILLALLGGLVYFVAGPAAGIAVINEAVELVVDGIVNPDWPALRCYVGWVKVFLQNLYNALHELLKLSGFGFPYTAELAHNALLLDFTGEVNPLDAALNTARSQANADVYPRSRWQLSLTNASNWVRLPTEPLEPPPVHAYNNASVFPFHFVDGIEPTTLGQLNALRPAPSGRPMIRDRAVWDDRSSRLNARFLVSAEDLFGNAVDVSLDLLGAPVDELLNWDRDADPGNGFPTWRLPTAGSARSAAVPE
jgi:hypothetical protein